VHDLRQLRVDLGERVAENPTNGHVGQLVVVVLRRVRVVGRNRTRPVGNVGTSSSSPMIVT